MQSLQSTIAVSPRKNEEKAAAMPLKVLLCRDGVQVQLGQLPNEVVCTARELTPFPSFWTISYLRRTCLSTSSIIFK